MCVCPISIKNNKIDLDVRIDKASFQVPCGHCWQCDLQKKQSWRARAIAEYLAHVKVGGSVFYYTLTFNEESLPKYNDMPCFDKKLVQRFLKRVRHALEPISMKYLLTSEFGDLKGRPHHHVLFFLSLPYDSSKFYRIIEKNWSKGRYNYGFIQPGNFNGVVNSSQAVDYVTKYITKAHNFDYEKFEIVHKGIIDNIENDIIECKKEDELQKFEDIRFREDSAYKNSLPFHLQSIGFGRYLDSFVNESTLYNNVIKLSTYKGIKDFPIPLYTLRHFCYDSVVNKNGNVSFVLNDLGKKIKLAKCDKQVDSTSFAYNELVASVDNSDIENHPILNLLFNSAEDFRLHISTLLDGACLRDVAIYSLFYRGYTTDCILQFDNYKDDLNLLFKSNYTDTWPLLDEFDYVSILPKFVDFDEIIFLLDCCLQLCSYSKYVDAVNNYNALQLQYNKPNLINCVTLNEFIDGKF